MVTRLEHTNSSALFEKYDFLQAFFSFSFFFFFPVFRLYKQLKEIQGNNDLDFSLSPSFVCLTA